jgi:nicotinate phosphoribosyltransferase
MTELQFAPDRPKYYREALAEKSALWADLYALTMSQALFTNGKHDITTAFQGFIRKLPFDGGYLMTGGQNIIAEWLGEHWKFNQRNLEQMRDKQVLNPKTGKMEPLFTPEFIDYVGNAKLELTVDMIREGDLAFPDEPIVRVRGPAWQCMMVEAAILNTINSQSLFATLASRIKEATRSQSIVGFTKREDRNPAKFLDEMAPADTVLEFGLRRAQCIGGLESSRGAYLGGIDATSNTLAEEYYYIPTSGTFAHALVMMYEDELEAFSDYAKAMPNNGIFLVDTYNTLEGVKKAIEACRKTGATMKGIRLDSGDLAYLSKESRKLLDAAGFKDAKIAASNDLDEAEIVKLKRQGAKIDIWGIGTHLVTAKAQPALGGVYKIVAVYDPALTLEQVEDCRKAFQEGRVTPAELGEIVRNVIKLGEKPPPGQQEKATIPGEQLVLRTLFNNKAEGTWRYDGDVIFPADRKLPYKMVENPEGPYEAVLTEPVISISKSNPDMPRVFPVGTKITLPLKAAFSVGAQAAPIETVHDGRKRGQTVLPILSEDSRRLDSPYPYGVGIEESLYDQQRAMIRKHRAPVAA